MLDIHVKNSSIIILIMKESKKMKFQSKKLLELAAKISPYSIVSLKRSLSVNKSNLNAFVDSVQSYQKSKRMKTDHYQEIYQEKSINFDYQKQERNDGSALRAYRNSKPVAKNNNLRNELRVRSNTISR